VPSQLFAEILRLIDRLRPRPAPACEWGSCNATTNEAVCPNANSQTSLLGMVMPVQTPWPRENGRSGFRAPQEYGIFHLNLGSSGARFNFKRD
jgi:hypothetical protein